MLRKLLFVLCMATVFPAYAQLTAPVKNGETTITVTGKRERPSKVEMSKWRMAETPHVVVFSQNDDDDLHRTAHNLEKLHFLLSALFGRVDVPDDTLKIAVIMIGHAGEFEQLRLTDLRWQYGPFPYRFAKTVYYDPREEGPVLATTKDGVSLVLRPSLGRPTSRNCDGDAGGPAVLDHGPINTTISPTGALQVDPNQFLQQFAVNELAFCQSAESRLYAAFAQNYLMTYFPAAYPRWFLQGFGEIFGTMIAGDDFVEYGHTPPGYFQVLEHYRYTAYPVAHILDGRYLREQRHWTPYHAWRLVHLLYFSEEWKPRLHAYLDAIARGADLQTAANALGDADDLQKAVTSYRRRKLQAERIRFPAEHAPEPTIRRLTRAEAGLIRGRLELGARIEVPAEEGRERSEALERRAKWLEQLRENALKFPDLVENQLLLAEAECRSGNAQQCLDAADRAIALSPRDPVALAWAGTALTQLAVQAPVEERTKQLKEARKLIVRANRRDKDGILPLIAYYNSFRTAGEQAPDMATEGLAKIVVSSPAAPSPRLKLGEEFIRRDQQDAARKTLLPVAKGAFDSPERAAALALLPGSVAAQPGSPSGGSTAGSPSR